jgi:ribose transport system substrate-binding protein
MKKAGIIVVCIMMVLMVFAGCQQDSAADNTMADDTAADNASADDKTADDATVDDATDEQIVIGVSLLTRSHVFYNKIEEALVARAQELGYELDIADANRDSNTQMSQVQDFITKGVDAVILCPTSSSGIKSSIDLCKEAGIPVFTMDIAAEEGEVACHVGTDNYEGGKLAAEYTAKNILENESGKVAIVTYSEVESCVNREQGFVDVMETYPNIEVVDIQNSSGDSEKSANVTQDMLLKYADLDVIFGVGDPFAMGALSAIKSANRDVKIIGFDGNPEGIAEILKGDLWIADVAQDPAAIGITTLNMVKDYLAGNDVPPIQMIAPQIIDITNAE